MSHQHHLRAAAQANDDSTRENHTDAAVPATRGRFATLWSASTAVIGTVMGLLPHVLHHVGLFAGAVLVTGAAGNVLFGVLGLVLSVPLLRRLYRRFSTWKTPAAAMAVFAVMFSLSAFVIGPAISNDPPAPSPVQTPVQTPDPDEHPGHHGD